jgi:phosphatidate cytidylyltransferase
MLKTRIITATILMAVLLPILFLLPPIYLGIFFLVALLAAAWEWSRMIAPEAKKSAWLYAVFCLTIILFLLGMQAIAWQFSLLMMAVLFWFFLAPFILAKGMNLSLQKFKPFYSILGLIILPATWFALAFLRELGLVFLLTSMALVWVADIGAYFVALGGLDAIVFTGTVGERSFIMRERICQDLSVLGIKINPEINNQQLSIEQNILIFN